MKTCCRIFFNRILSTDFSKNILQGRTKSMRNEQSERANKTLKRVYLGELTPLQAVLEIDNEIGGITGIDHRVGTNIRNHTQKISLERKGLGRKEMQKLEEFATLAYWKAQRNRSLFPGEVHLGKGISSKHYKANFQAYQQTLLATYAQ